MSLVQDRFDLDFTEIKMDGQSYYIKRQSSETLNNSVDSISERFKAKD